MIQYYWGMLRLGLGSVALILLSSETRSITSRHVGVCLAEQASFRYWQRVEMKRRTKCDVTMMEDEWLWINLVEEVET